MIDSKDSASKRPLAKPSIAVKVVLTAPEMQDSFSDNIRGKKLDSEHLLCFSSVKRVKSVIKPKI